ncbi:hypothetical protein C8N36_11864 [Pelagimonas varians]|uniref:Uncharacterized protein n=1 Tax=Pelagimonas varians TaxID=696760 RepID=A0A238K596_9RHOB|nr:hypothetical protein C8N36_11864 [Pelagimonas varians]SMX37096.1 hypothetical protein PEV8663_00917 [Pelagimonas varians]
MLPEAQKPLRLPTGNGASARAFSVSAAATGVSGACKLVSKPQHRHSACVRKSHCENAAALKASELVDAKRTAQGSNVLCPLVGQCTLTRCEGAANEFPIYKRQS